MGRLAGERPGAEQQLALLFGSVSRSVMDGREGGERLGGALGGREQLRRQPGGIYIKLGGACPATHEEEEATTVPVAAPAAAGTATTRPEPSPGDTTARP